MKSAFLRPSVPRGGRLALGDVETKPSHGSTVASVGCPLSNLADDCGVLSAMNKLFEPMRSDTQAWDEIFRQEGRVFLEPFPRFPEVVRDFQEHGCLRLLDLGCGSGRHVVQFAKEGFQTWGLDGAPHGLHLAREWLQEEGLGACLVQADMREPLPFQDCTFDGLLSTQVIHHARISQVRGTIGEIWRILTPGGLAFVSVSGQKHDDEEYEEVEPGTWVPTSGPEAGLPHHIFSEEELRAEFSAFHVLESSVRAEGRVVVVVAQKW